MNENVTHSLKPAEVASRRSARSCSSRCVGRRRHLRERREGRRQPVVAVVACDFLDQVDVARDVHSPRRHGHQRVVGRLARQHEAQAGQDATDVVDRHVGAQHGRDPRVGEPDDARRGRRGAGVDPAPAHGAGANLLDEAAGAGQRLGRGGKVGAALEAIRRLGGQAEPLAGPVGSTWARTRRSRARSSSSRPTPRCCAPPMMPASACARSRSAITSISGVSVRFCPSSVVSVSPGPRRADAQCRAGQRRQVEGMQRMAQLEQHVVGDVDDVADRADACGREPLGQPGGRGPDGHIGDGGAVARARRPGSRS